MSEDCSHISECPASGEGLIKHVQLVKYISVASILIRNCKFEYMVCLSGCLVLVISHAIDLHVK